MKLWIGLLILLLQSCLQPPMNYSTTSDGVVYCTAGSESFVDCTSEIPNARSATRRKVCQDSGTSYGLYACTLHLCESGFEMQSNQCVSTMGSICAPGSTISTSCTSQILNASSATRIDTCNSSGTGYNYGSCVLHSCIGSYEVSGNQCNMVVTPTPTVAPTPSGGANYIADQLVATEAVLRSIPTAYIDSAREQFVVAYQHTSHGTHVSRGMFGLQDYKSGDNQLFGISSNGESGKLDFRDYAMAMYRSPGDDASDLSRNETAFIQATRNYLDHANGNDVNVVMWSWCDIAGHDVAGNYLPGIATLVSEYGPGGSKARAASNPVHFILMTGHANTGANLADGQPARQAELINNFCRANNLFCLDYYGIDSHDMAGNYWNDAGDNGNSSSYQGNFYQDWQDTHQLGTHWFNNKSSPGGSISFGAHNTQHITANRKAYAMWYILARLAGWDGVSQ